ncbi:hypothetical protein [Kutzneria albida]|uniref:Uncharacterized protein n=1 Tax=Kutzneria albida DSM 43870 TaxID=1449976 RepID=W5WJI2_9PSEU|nr:hypothetical protein [Kutzneria albida]AHH98324.1 hypothetical protein KALB_4962 [Kutzneria albida DSM 43870]
MNIMTKAVASIEPGDDDAEQPNGSFHVILSAQSKDRDGEVLRHDEWDDLPDWINFDIDHAMTVEKTIGSGVPTIEDDGNLHVRGTYSSLRLAQDVRTLVNERHVRNTSVTFMTRKEQKDGKTVVKRELLNGAFVAIPSNRDTVVLESKGLDVTAKAGARNSARDAKQIQAIHDAAADLGASCSGADAVNADTGAMDGANKSAVVINVPPGQDLDKFAMPTATRRLAVAGALSGAALAELSQAAETAKTGVQPERPARAAKALSNSVEDLQARISDVLADIYSEEDGDNWTYLQATFLDEDAQSGTIVYCLNGDSLSRTFTDDGNQVVLGDQVTDVTIVTSVVPEGTGEPDEQTQEQATGKSVGAKAISDEDWDGSASRFTLEQYRASCLIGPSEASEDKADYKLPVKEPNGDVNRNAVHAAAAALAGGRGGVDASDDEKKAAAKTLIALYGQLKEDPPDSLVELAGDSPKDDAKSADPAAADVKSAAAVSADEVALRARALQIEVQAHALQ